MTTKKLLAFVLSLVLLVSLSPLSSAAFSLPEDTTDPMLTGGILSDIDATGLLGAEPVENNSSERINFPITDTITVQKKATQFHCNHNGGNGRVWPYGKDDSQMIKLVFEKASANANWVLIDVRDTNGNSLGLPVCPEDDSGCGCSNWIVYSNNGKETCINGNNPQMYHDGICPPPPPPHVHSFSYAVEKSVRAVDALSSAWFDEITVASGSRVLYKVEMTATLNCSVGCTAPQTTNVYMSDSVYNSQDGVKTLSRVGDTNVYKLMTTYEGVITADEENIVTISGELGGLAYDLDNAAVKIAPPDIDTHEHKFAYSIEKFVGADIDDRNYESAEIAMGGTAFYKVVITAQLDAEYCNENSDCDPTKDMPSNLEVMLTDSEYAAINGSVTLTDNDNDGMYIAEVSYAIVDCSEGFMNTATITYGDGETKQDYANITIKHEHDFKYDIVKYVSKDNASWQNITEEIALNGTAYYKVEISAWCADETCPATDMPDTLIVYLTDDQAPYADQEVELLAVDGYFAEVTYQIDNCEEAFTNTATIYGYDEMLGKDTAAITIGPGTGDIHEHSYRYTVIKEVSADGVTWNDASVTLAQNSTAYFRITVNASYNPEFCNEQSDCDGNFAETLSVYLTDSQYSQINGTYTLNSTGDGAYSLVLPVYSISGITSSVTNVATIYGSSELTPQYGRDGAGVNIEVPFTIFYFPPIGDIDVPEVDVPLALPPEDDFIIEDEDVPLAELPKTGASGNGAMAFSVLLFAAGGALAVMSARKKSNEA